MRKYGDVLRVVIEFLNKNKIPYMVVGAVSIAIYGQPRTSEDIDLLIKLEGSIKKFVGFLKKNDFSVSAADIKKALNEKSHFTVFDRLSVYRLDVKGIYTQFDRESFARRRKNLIHGMELWVNSPEDAILSKLSFGSEQDLMDARSIFLLQKKLDMRYLAQSATRMGVYDKLKNLLKEIEKRKKYFKK